MVQQAGPISYQNVNPLEKLKSIFGKNKTTSAPNADVQRAYQENGLLPYNVSNFTPVKMRLETQEQKAMYNDISSALINNPEFKTSLQDGVLMNKKLDDLLKSGKLLNSSSNDKSSTLENLHNILNTPRTAGFNNVEILAQTIDAIHNPTVITQNFGDIPEGIKQDILNSPYTNADKSLNPSLLDVQTSGTCVAASIEFHLANKHPAEFSRWVSSLTSPKQEVEQSVDLKALSSNKLDAISFINIFEAKQKDFNFDKVTLSLKPDSNAYVRGQIQDAHWDKGERTIIDVLMQSTLMQVGSQNSYNSLTDMRAGKFSSNPQGLVETEKTFIESIVENNEKHSIQYQIVDENQNLAGYNCDFSVIQKHILDTINIGEDVIVGYVLTNETGGVTKSLNYQNTPDNAPNKIINGHEITIVDYKKDANGKITFICNDTDDDKSELVEYSADYLIPKIHHAAYPVSIIENDLALIEGH